MFFFLLLGFLSPIQCFTLSRGNSVSRRGLLHLPTTCPPLSPATSSPFTASCTSSASINGRASISPSSSKKRKKRVEEKERNAFYRLVTFPQRQWQRLGDFFAKELPMMRYLWPEDSPRLRLFLVLSLVFMVLGKWFNLRVPFILQRAVDSMSHQQGFGKAAVLGNELYVAAAQAIAWYGIARGLSVFCSEIKTCLFTHVSQNVLRKFSSEIFRHLHSLDASFHLQTPSGVVSVAYLRAVRGFQTMLFQIVFSVAPTALELAMVSKVLWQRFGPAFASLTLATFSAYLAFTIWVTRWRLHLRQDLVDLDNARNGFFIDSILNHEVVKLFTNERREAKRYDSFLTRLQQLNIETTVAVAWLNVGQAILFGLGLVSSLLLALHRVRRGTMTVGDLIAVNSLLLQLAVPFNFIGFTCKPWTHSLRVYPVIHL